MRVSGPLLAFVTLTAVLAAREQAPAPRDAAAVLAAAREALGGEQRLVGIKSLVATGRTRQVRGDNLVPIEFEIACELPDKYVRKDEIPAQETGVTSLGFNGDELIQLPPPATPPAPPPGSNAPAMTPERLDAMRKARVQTIKQDFARLMLGLFAGSFNSYPLTFSYVAQAEAPQGKADVIEAKGAGNFTARLFVSADTHLPIMVTWQAPAAGRGPMTMMGPGRGAMPPGAAPPGAPTPASPSAPQRGATPPPGAAAPPAGATPPPAGAPPPAGPGRADAPPAGRGQPATPPPENRLYFADYRDSDGVKLPYRIRRAVGTETTEETTFDKFKINGKIDPKKFEVRK